ncbi:MAG TPA: sulfur carrier protein ThiS [Solirubrobacteraceae bacterium]|nr:sulfur carrier protein ThiS [Solirubrobacteraceae bacterium]
MIVSVNGRPRELPDEATIVTVLDALELAPERRGVAVAVDATVVPRGRWAEHRLHPDAAIEVVAAIQGG